MIGHITVTSGSNISQGASYTPEANLAINVGGFDVVALSALGIVVLVALMFIFSRPKENA